MLTLVTVIWYVCGALFTLYLIICAIFIIVLEKEVSKKSQELLSTCKELASLDENGMRIAEADVNSLSKSFAAICRSSPNAMISFDFYRQKEIVEKAANDYNEAAQRYNELVDGFPACAVARAMGKSPVMIFYF